MYFICTICNLTTTITTITRMKDEGKRLLECFNLFVTKELWLLSCNAEYYDCQHPTEILIMILHSTAIIARRFVFENKVF